MNERDFDQYFKENLPTEQPFQFKESNWDDLAHRLQTVQTPKLSWWQRNTMLLAAASILLVSNVVWYNLWKNTEKEVQSIRNLIVEENTSSKIKNVNSVSEANLSTPKRQMSSNNTTSDLTSSNNTSDTKNTSDLITSKNNTSKNNLNTTNLKHENTTTLNRINTGNAAKKWNKQLVESTTRNESVENTKNATIANNSSLNASKKEEKSVSVTNLETTSTTENNVTKTVVTTQNTNNTTTTDITATTIPTDLSSKKNLATIPSITLNALKEPKTKLPRLDDDYLLLRPATKHRSTINNRFVVGLSKSWIGVQERDFDHYQEGLTRLSSSFRLTNKFELFASGALGEKSIKGRGEHGPHKPENIPQGVEVKRFEQEDHIGQASIGLRYNLLSFKGFTPFVSSEYLYQVVKHKDARFFGENPSGEQVFLPTDPKKFKNNQAQYAIVGAGLKYNLTPRWILTSNVNYEKEITPKAKEYLDRYSLWLGVAYVIK